MTQVKVPSDRSLAHKAKTLEQILRESFSSHFDYFMASVSSISQQESETDFLMGSTMLSFSFVI